MNVRSTVKAIALHEDKVLLNRCRDGNNGDYYSLPGGGQEQYETLAEAIHRECLEETGYSVEPVRFCALMEEICLDPVIREQYAQYAHKMLHIFLCRLTSTERVKPTETDDLQIATEWVPVEDVPKMNLLPKEVRAAFDQLLSQDAPQFLGSVYLEHNHG
ncbi:MAG: NUDIX domain-containing protein [Eubacteriales bacterium]|nr:NUDIX domain-containing protein [Eubacteriales bacterium]